MHSALYILAFFASQSFSANPLYWSFVEMTVARDRVYSALYAYTNSGRAPIVFLASNTSANYNSSNWMDPCYERFLKYSQKWILFWEINGNMYCETVTYSTSSAANTATYAQKYLMRVEIPGTRCK